MNIPAVAIAAGFACVIVIGQSRVVAAHAAERWFLFAIGSSAGAFFASGSF